MNPSWHLITSNGSSFAVHGKGDNAHPVNSTSLAVAVRRGQGNGMDTPLSLGNPGGSHEVTDRALLIHGKGGANIGLVRRPLMPDERALADFALSRPRPVTSRSLALIAAGEEMILWQKLRARMKAKADQLEKASRLDAVAIDGRAGERG